MAMKPVKPTVDHEKFRSAFLDLLHEHAGHLPGIECLAIASHCIGQMIAYQDAQKHTPDELLSVIMMNIERGNYDAMLLAANFAGSA